MKKIYVLLFLFLSIPICSIGQQKPEKKDERIKFLEKSKRKLVSKLDEDGPIFQQTVAPEKWKNESAVILLDYTKVQRIMENKAKPRGEVSRVYLRKRILLQDQSAINDFSHFQLYENELLEITVIKPDGSKIVLDKSKAVHGELRIEDYFGLIPYSIKVNGKIPVPNLEPGDIIEIESYWENVEPYYTGKGLQRLSLRNSYRTVELNGKYPTCHRIIDFDLAGYNRINWKSMNGAPELQVVKVKKKEASYRFHDSLRDRTKAEYWSPGTLRQPYVKYLLNTYVRGKGVKEDYQNKNFEEPLSSINEEQIKKTVYILHSRMEHLTHSGVMRSFILKYADEVMDDETFVKRFYEYYRGHFYMKMTDDVDDVLANPNFILIMKRILEKKHLDYEYIVGIPKTIGTLDDIISLQEIVFGIRVKETGEIYQVFNAYSIPGELSELLRGTEVYVIQPAKRLKKMAISRETLELSKPEDHKYAYEIKASLLPGFSTLKLERTNAMQGVARYGYMSRMPYTLFLNDFETHFGEEALHYSISSAYYEDIEKEEYEEEKHRLDTMFVYALNESARDNMAESLDNKYFEVDEYNELTLLQDGRSHEANELKYKECFEVKGLVGRAGEYYVVDLGRLLGQQMEILDSEDTVRTQDVYFGYPRTIQYTLKFEIPAGMKVSGHEQFNYEVDNEIGTYTITSEVRGDMLFITATKKYKVVMANKSDWPKVLSFTEAASELSSKKIVLKR